MRYEQRRISMEELRKTCHKWSLDIKEDYCPDLIVFIAKSGFVIAEEFSKTFDIPMAEIMASRVGGKMKKRIAPLFRKMPLSIRNRIVASKFAYTINDRKQNRDVVVPHKLREMASTGKYRRILLIDDSVDTGWTFINVMKTVKKMFDCSEIKTLSLIEMSYSNKRFTPDYSLFRDVLLMTPAQMDSTENELFLDQYYAWESEWNG